MRNVLIGFSVLFCLGTSFRAGAQPAETSASLIVNVQDTAGLPIPAAVVSVMDQREGRRWRHRRGRLGTPAAPGELACSETDANGQAVFPELIPGVLSVMASADAFFFERSQPGGIERQPGDHAHHSTASQGDRFGNRGRHRFGHGKPCSRGSDSNRTHHPTGCRAADQDHAR